MKRQLTLSVVLAALILMVLMPGAALAQLDNKGNDFIITFLPQISNGSLELHLTADTATQVTVQYPVNSPTFNTTVSVNPGAVTIVGLPLTAMNSWPIAAPANNAVHAFSTKEFVAYVINRAPATSDAGLGLPIDTWNTQYIVTDYLATISSAPAEFIVVAGYDGTTVTIKPTVATTSGQAAGVPFNVTLNRGEGYLLKSLSSMTGTTVDSDKPVSVTNGVGCTNIVEGACDHIFEIAQPVQSWGLLTIGANLPLRTGTIYRMIASQNATTFLIDGGVVATNVAKGGFFTTAKIPGNHVFEGNKPIFVEQYMTGLPPGGTGDPSMGNLIPPAQYLDSYTFSTVGGGQFAQNFVTIIANNLDVGTLKLDGASLAPGQYTAIGTSGYSVTLQALGSGTHTTKSDHPHGITVEGYNTADSYLYPGGALFQAINPIGDPYKPVINPTFVAGTPPSYTFTATDNIASEDLNNNHILDPGEDLNNNDVIDKDTGIFQVLLDAGASNLSLNVPSYVPGAGSVSFSVTLVDPLQTGTGVLRVVDGAGNQSTFPVSLTGFVKTTPPITWANPADITWPAALGAELNATASVPGTLTYVQGAGTVLSPGNGQVLTVNFVPADTNQYNNASATVTINVLKAGSTVTVTCSDATYTGSAIETCAAEATGAGNLSVTLTPSYADNLNAGTASASAHFDGDAFHTSGDGSANFTINKADSLVTLTCSNGVYTGSAQETCAAEVNGVGGLHQSLTVSYVNNVNAGTAKASASFAGDDNHNASGASALFEIAKRQATVTIDKKTKIYGEADPDLTGKLDNFVSSDNVTVTYSRVPGETVAGSPYSITAKLTASPAPCGQAPASAPPKAPQPAPGSVEAPPKGGRPEPTPEPAPGCSTLGLDNYDIATIEGDLTITVRPITITADAKTKVYGTSDPALTYAITSGSLAFSDSFSGSLVRLGGENVGTYAIQQGSVALDSNYALTYAGADLTITQAPSATTITSSLNPSTYGQTVTFTAKVTSPNGAPTGSISFMDGATVLATVPLAAGQAQFSTLALAAGSHSISAVYSGDQNFVTSNAGLAQTVNLSPTKTTISTSVNPSLLGTAVTFTAVVVSVAPGAGVPTGFVTFTDGATVIGTSPVSATGVAMLTTSSLLVGSHPIVATYNTDGNYLSSASTPLNQIVYAFAGTGSFVIGDKNAILGNSVMFWGAQWEKNNSLTGPMANASFKGFANRPSTTPPAAGGTWITDPGNSSNPPASIPAYMGIIVASTDAKNGSTISGNTVKIVVVQTNAGYDADPGHAGTGTIIAIK